MAISKEQFAKIEVGDRLRLAGVGEVEVTSVQKERDWRKWNQEGRPEGQADEYPYTVTWAFEVSSGHYIKAGDRGRWLRHIEVL